MATEERDSTADWIVPAERRPPSAFDLRRQIEVAAAVARAAEEAAMEIGQASLEAAEQARTAAAHAERSAEASVAAARAAEAASAAVERSPATGLGGEAAGPDRGAAAPLTVVSDDDGSDGSDPPAGHESIPGSELPVAWSPVAPPPPRRRPAARGDAPAPVAQIPLPASSAPAGARRGAQPDPFDERMVAFRRRAERVLARLVRLEAASPVS